MSSAAPAADAAVAEEPTAAEGEGGLLGLHLALQDAKFVVGPRELLLATQLLLRLQELGQLGDDGQRLKPMLRAVYCKSRGEQERFGPIFDGWLATRDAWRREVPPQPDGDGRRDLVKDRSTDLPQPPPARRWWLPLLLLAVMVGATLWLGRGSDGPAQVSPPKPALPASGALSRDAPTPEPGDAAGTPASVAAPAPTAPGVVQGEPDGATGLEPRQVLQREFEPWLAAVLLGLPLPLLLLVYAPALALSRRHADRQRQGGGVRLDVSAWRTEAERMVPPLDGATAARLDRHVRLGPEAAEHGARRAIDPARTLAATLRRHGRFTLRWRARRTRPAYLVLIDVRDENDLRGRLFFRWADRLRREGVAVDIWLFDGDPRTLVPGHQRRVRDAAGADRNTVRLEHVAQRALADTVSRLIVVSDGGGFFDAAGQLQPWWSQLGWQRWPERVMFTPVDSRAWSEREVAIERALGRGDPGFLVLPLEAEALQAWAVHLTQGELPEIVLSGARRYPTLLDKLDEGGLAAEAPPPEQVEKLVAQLRLYLGENGLRWLAACALPPVSRWELTLLIGQELFGSPPGTTEDELRWMLNSHYARLARLPWLRSASFPDWLALRLLDELSPPVQQRIREVVRRLLEQVPGEQAAAEHEVLALDCTPPRAAGASAGGGREAPADPARARRQWLYLGFLDGLTPRQLAMRAPGSWRQWLGAPRSGAGGWRAWGAVAADWLRAWLARLMWRDGRAESGVSPLPLLLSLGWLVGTAVLLQVLADRPPTELPAQLVRALFVEKRSDAGAVSEVPYREIVFSGDGRRFATLDAAGEIRVHENDDRATPVGPPRLARPEVFGIFLDMTGDTLWALHDDGVYRLDAGVWRRWGGGTPRNDDPVRLARVDPQRRWLMALRARDAVTVTRLFGVAAEVPVVVPQDAGAGAIREVAVAADRVIVVTGALRLVYDAATGERVDVQRTARPAPLAQAAQAAGTPSQKGAAAAAAAYARVRKAAQLAPIAAQPPAFVTRLRDAGAPSRFWISPDGQAVVVGYENGGADLRSYVGNEREGLTRELRGFDGLVEAVAFGPGPWVTLVDESGEVGAWGLGGPEVTDLRAVPSALPPLQAAGLPDAVRLHHVLAGSGRLAIAAGGERQLGLRAVPDLDRAYRLRNSTALADQASGGASAQLPPAAADALPGPVLSAPLRRIQADGDALVTTDAQNELRLWRVARLAPLAVPPAIAASAAAAASAPSVAASAAAVPLPPPVALSADGRWAAKGGADGQVLAWDVATGRLRSRWSTGSLPLRTLSLSADGSRLLTVDDDGVAQAWSVSSGTALGRSLRLRGDRWELSHSGEALLTWSERDTTPWRITDEGLVAGTRRPSQADTVAASWDWSDQSYVVANSGGLIARHALSGDRLGQPFVAYDATGGAPTQDAPTHVTVPELKGRTLVEARQRLISAGLGVRVVAQNTPSRALPGTVVEVRPGSSGIPVRSTVVLVVAGSGCANGWVQRQAYAGDPACVRPEVQAQVQRDNAAAASRRDPKSRTFGPDTCLAGYVWREADRPPRGEKFTDKVCVTPDQRDQAAQDNRQQRARLAAGYGDAPPPPPLPSFSEQLRRIGTAQDARGAPVLVIQGSSSARLARMSGAVVAGPVVEHAGISDARYWRERNLLLTAGTDGLVRFWDADTGEEQGLPLRQGAPIVRMQPTLDGRHLAVASTDGRVRVWSLAARRALPPGVAHARGQAASFALDARGLHLVSAGADGAVQLQRLPAYTTGELRVVRPHVQFWLWVLGALVAGAAAVLLAQQLRRGRLIERLAAGRGGTGEQALAA